MKHLFSKKNIIISVLIISFLTLCVTIYLSIPKVRVARMGYVIENYNGMRDARQKLDDLKAKQEREVDSLKKEFNKVYYLYIKDSNNIQIRSNLIFCKNKIDQVIENNSSTFNEQDKLISQGIINQINEIIESECNKNGIDILLGQYNSEGVLFAIPAFDISDQLIESCNLVYEGKVE